MHNGYEYSSNSIDPHFETYEKGKHIRKHLNVEYAAHENVTQFDDLFFKNS
jgi:hypothetical protein